MHLLRKIRFGGTLTAAVFLGAAPAALSVSARFAAIYWAHPQANPQQAQSKLPELYFRDGGSFKQLEPQLAQLGRQMDYSGPSSMEIYRREAAPDGQWQYLPVAVASLPEQSSAFLLFLSAAQTGGGYHAAAVDIGSRAIPNGKIALLNLTGTQLAADVRGDRQALLPSQVKVFTPQGEAGDSSLPLKIAIFDEEWKPAYGTVLSVLPDQPYLMVFYAAGEHKGAYRMRMFRDIRRLRERPISVVSNES